MTAHSTRCGECNGTGVYQGLLAEETCRACGGGGAVLDDPGDQLPPDAVNDRYKESVELPAAHREAADRIAAGIESQLAKLPPVGAWDFQHAPVRSVIRNAAKQQLIDQVVDFIDDCPQAEIERFADPHILLVKRMTPAQLAKVAFYIDHFIHEPG